jgi:regulator of cell morphogenesis and NO signaling
MTITEKTTVADIASAIPSSVRVFQQHGIDFCCGGKTPLAVACDARGLSFAALSQAIEQSATTPAPDVRDWRNESLDALIWHIVRTYHDPLRKELPRLAALSSKAAEVHGAKGAFLRRVAAIVAELSDELTSHMQKEEMILFPAIRALEEGRSTLPLAAPIAVMEHEHDGAGLFLDELRRITGGYELPPWACATIEALYHGLSELESAMHVHVHLENNVLFPRALALPGRG